MRNENCWYKDVCTYDTCVNCIRYAEMKYLIDNTDGATCDVAYSDKVTIRLIVPEKSAATLIDQINEKTAARSVAKLLDTKML